jgi:gliding motility-associated protein GldM
MASSKLPPRQKMIGLMYLVLTAILALNVSKEVLDAFIVVNNGLEITEKNFSRNNSQLYTEFDQLKLYDSKRVTPNWKKAQEARLLALDLSSFLAATKKQLIRETEGFKHKEEDTIRLGHVVNKDDFNACTRILVGNDEDGSAGLGREIKNKLNTYREKMLSLLEPEDRKSIHLSIDTKDPARTEDESSKNWELYNFYHTPLAAAVTILSKFETDARDAESEVVERLLSRSNGETIPFDTVAAKVVSESNYVLLGEKYKADVFIAAFNKTLRTDVISGDYDPVAKTFKGKTDSVPVTRGMGKYTADASSEGFKKMRGIIRMVSPKGKVFEYPYESEYIVARPSLTVSADKMNVMYSKLVNPISVSVPGVANDRLTVSMDNGQLTSKGNGKFEVRGAKPGHATVRVMADMGNGEKRLMGEISFKVKSLPKPMPKIGELTTSGRMKKDLLMQSALLCFYDPNFDFEAKAHVISFTMITLNSSTGLTKETRVTGCLISPECQKIIKNLKKNEVVSFVDIKAVGADDVSVTLDPMAVIIQ